MGLQSLGSSPVNESCGFFLAPEVLPIGLNRPSAIGTLRRSGLPGEFASMFPAPLQGLLPLGSMTQGSLRSPWAEFLRRFAARRTIPSRLCPYTDSLARLAVFRAWQPAAKVTWGQSAYFRAQRPPMQTADFLGREKG